jgi:hypothetical protein
MLEVFELQLLFGAVCVDGRLGPSVPVQQRDLIMLSGCDPIPYEPTIIVTHRHRGPDRIDERTWNVTTRGRHFPSFAFMSCYHVYKAQHQY